MVRVRRRWRLPGARAAVRWVAADARDVACIQRLERGPGRGVPGDVAVATVAAGLDALAAPCGAAARCWPSVAAPRSSDSAPHASFNSARSRADTMDPAPGCCPPQCWPRGHCVGVAHRTSPVGRARLLDRDLDLGAGVTTALELEAQGSAPRDAVGSERSWSRTFAVRLAGASQARAHVFALTAARRCSSRHSSPRWRWRCSSRARAPTQSAGAVAARQAKQVNRALRADSGLPGAAAEAGGSRQSFAQTPLDAPPLAAVPAGGTTRAGGAASGRSACDAGRATDSQAGAGALSPTGAPGAGVPPRTAMVRRRPATAGVRAPPTPPETTRRQAEDDRTSPPAGSRAAAQPRSRPGASGDADPLPPRAQGRRPGTARRPPRREHRRWGQGRRRLAGKAAGGKGASAAGTAPGRKPHGSAPGRRGVGGRARCRRARARAWCRSCPAGAPVYPWRLPTGPCLARVARER